MRSDRGRRHPAREGCPLSKTIFSDQAAALDLTTLPRIVFTTPQIAVAGLTDAEANAAGYERELRVLPLTAVPRTLVHDDTRGLVKIVANASISRTLIRPRSIET